MPEPANGGVGRRGRGRGGGCLGQPMAAAVTHLASLCGSHPPPARAAKPSRTPFTDAPPSWGGGHPAYLFSPTLPTAPYSPYSPRGERRRVHRVRAAGAHVTLFLSTRQTGGRVVRRGGFPCPPRRGRGRKHVLYIHADGPSSRKETLVRRHQPRWGGACCCCCMAGGGDGSELGAAERPALAAGGDRPRRAIARPTGDQVPSSTHPPMYSTKRCVAIAMHRHLHCTPNAPTPPLQSTWWYTN